MIVSIRYISYSLIAICLLLASCRSEGDKHPEVMGLYEAIEQHPDFDLQPMFSDKSLSDVEVVGPYLFASHFSTASGDTVINLSVEVWYDGDSVRSFEMPSHWGNYGMAQDADSNIYQGKYRILAPDYTKIEMLPVISRDSMEVSLKRLKTILATTDMTVSAEDLQDVFGKSYKQEHTDSLTGLLFGNYTNDETEQDSSYRRHLYFFFKNCTWYMKHDDFAIVHFGQRSYFWELERERTSVVAMLTQFHIAGGEEHGRQTSAYSRGSGDGPIGMGQSCRTFPSQSMTSRWRSGRPKQWAVRMLAVLSFPIRSISGITSCRLMVRRNYGSRYMKTLPRKISHF